MTKRNDIEVIFKAHYSRLRRLALAIVRDDEVARDIVVYFTCNQVDEAVK
ncbi:MAG: hypothetical protein ACI4AX_08300 [Muribaculaceae bacterium]